MSASQILAVAALVAAIGFAALCVIAAVATFNHNPVKKSFDTDADVFNSHPEEQDK